MKKSVYITVLLLVISYTAVAQSVKGKIYNDLGGKTKKNAAGLVVYLIPSVAENSKIIKSISTYEASCPERLMKTAKNYQVAVTDKDGNYYFSRILPGSYLLKVCTYMGGYYSFSIKTPFKGTIALPDFEADPPVK